MEKCIRPVFTLELNSKLIPGLVTIAKYDGTHPCLTAATSADKVLIHSPHRRNTPHPTMGRVIWSESNREMATLNINQPIGALIAGNLLPQDDKDILLVGTETHLLAYHVHDNRDVFYVECPDGAKALCLGCFKEWRNVVMVGGNSSVHGFNHKGEEIFWTTIGDAVTSILLMDYNRDDSNEMIVSSEDFNIRIYNGDQVIGEHFETEVVTGLAILPESRFAYSVSNGTVGVYEQEVRLWRVKSKHFAVAMQSYDLLGQGSTQLITGWSNGKIDCRSVKTGEVLFKDTMNSGVAGVVEGDYRSIGKADVICVSTEGEVRGYTTTKSLPAPPGAGQDQDTVRELLSKRQSLLLELKHYENNTRYNETAGSQTESFEADGVIPANTRLQIGIATNDASKSRKTRNDKVEIFVATNNSTIIRSVVIFAEGIFSGETHVVHPPLNKLSSEVVIPLFLPKDNPVDIHIKTLVGYPNSQQYHVFEMSRQLPRFSMYSMITTTGPTSPKSDDFVEFRISERLQRICLWINQNFLLSTELELETASLNLTMRCLRDSSELSMIFDQSGKTFFCTTNMSLAADLVQSLVAFLKLENLQAKVSFPNEEQKLRKDMERLTEIQEARLRLGSDVADRLAQIRLLVIRAEDSRLNDIKEMPTYYNELNNINRELINSYNIRLQNYNDGLETMKSINSVIQRASRLRAGQHASSMINHCRTAIKNNNIEGLIRIIQTGEI